MQDNSSTVQVRQARRSDIESLVELNRVCYPTMAEDDVVWGRKHLETHQRVFPQGQLVAVVDNRILGACSSLVVDLGPDPLRNHTWAGITDGGYFYNHNPLGDTLYGADVYVHPDARGHGVGHALYEARRALCRRLNLRRILLGGRLWNYDEYADRFSPDEYAARVAAGELRDLVLSFQLREGFELRSVMPHYLRDRRSHNYASLLEWLNPDYRATGKTARKARIACVQYQMRRVHNFDDLAQQVRYFVDVAADYQSDYVLLPELFSLQLLSAFDVHSAKEGIIRLADLAHPYTELMRELATSFGLTIIAGSHPFREGDAIYNVAPVCLPDGTIVKQPKLHITPNERKWWGITGGHTLAVVHTPLAKIGVLICYDIEFPEAARHLADEGAEIIFVPFCTDNRQSFLRVRYCAQARAIENQLYVALAGNVGNLPAVENMDVNYGQAMVLTPSDFAFARDGIKAETDANDETVLICDVDLDDLHEARAEGTVTPYRDRRSDLFQQVVHFPQMPAALNDPADRPLGDQPHGEED
jgi:predicted amidohydrolase/GNAT superfamily N-acetyltransferase